MRRGDTIIEVLLAITVFSMVAVGAILMMNRGVAMSQRSLEITLVRQQIDAQAELLRYVHDQARQGVGYQSLWQSIVSGSLKEAGSQQPSTRDNACPNTAPEGGFTLRTSGEAGSRTILKELNYRPADVYAQANQPNGSHGIAIQLTRVSGANAYDAYVQGCWYSVGSSQPMSIETIVRLYDPAA